MKMSKMAKKKAMRKWGKLLFLVVMLIMMVSVPAYAGDVEKDDDDAVDATGFGMDRIDLIINWITGWTAKIGLIVAFFGGLQVCLGFMNDDADSKVSGLKTMAAGFMVTGISAMASQLFFVI